MDRRAGWYTPELVRDWCFPRFLGPIERTHCWTVMRAARQVAVRVRRDWPGGVVWRAANPISEMHDLIDVESANVRPRAIAVNHRGGTSAPGCTTSHRE